MMDDAASDLCLISIDRILYLRKHIAAALLEPDDRKARDILERALDETDIGQMKVWQKGEQPF